MSEENRETPENPQEENKQDKPQETPAQEPPKPESIFADQLGAIKNEQGVQKYNSVEDALKGAANAQEYIQTLKQQMQEKEDALAERERELQQYKGIEGVFKQESSEQNKEATTSEGLDEQRAEELFESMLTKREQERKIAENRQAVDRELVQQFGDVEKAKQAFETKARELEVSTQDLMDMASRSPKAVLAYFKNSNPNIDVKGSRRPESVKTPEEVNWNIFSGGVSRAKKLEAWRASKPQT